MPFDSSMHNFIWCSHGASISGNDVLFEVPTGLFIDTLLFYVPHDDIFYLSTPDSKLSERETAENEFGTDNALIINTEQHSENTHVANLPPMVFGAYSEDSSEKVYTNNMGLWYHPQQVPDEPNKPSTKILDFDDVVRMTNHYNKITYSIIFKYINDYIKKYISEETAMEVSETNEYYQDYVCLHFATCRKSLGQYLPEYTLTKQPEYIEDIPINALRIDPNIFSNTLKDDKIYMFARFKNNNSTILSDIDNFSALAEITHAGCGLNVLTLFKIIKQTFAREQTVCLPLTGQTIFNLVTQLVNFSDLEKLEYTWTVIRYPISQLNVIINALIQEQANNTVSIHDTFIVIKLYESDTHKGRDSHAGHTIALYFAIENGMTNMYMMDPQARHYINITRDTSGAFNNYIEFINKHYFDIVFREMPSDTVELWNIPVGKDGIIADGGRLIVYNTERYMGGEKPPSENKPPFKSNITINEFMKNFPKTGGSIVNKRRKNKQHKRTRKRTNKHKKSKTKNNKHNKRTNKHTKSKKGKGKKSKKLYTNKKTKKTKKL